MLKEAGLGLGGCQIFLQAYLLCLFYAPGASPKKVKARITIILKQ